MLRKEHLASEAKERATQLLEAQVSTPVKYGMHIQYVSNRDMHTVYYPHAPSEAQVSTHLRFMYGTAVLLDMLYICGLAYATAAV